MAIPTSELTEISRDEYIVAAINSIKKRYKSVREKSKTGTFALTYQGTHYTLMNSFGMDKSTALQIERSYHELYAVSDQWVQDRLDEAASCGYVTVAFGLRLRTPLLHKTLRNHSSTPQTAHAESRTAGNALGQSYGLLTNRALVEFMQRVWDSEYALCIKPCAMIHDAIYLTILDDINVVEWVNTHLIDCMRWQNLPELAHDTVKLGAELDVHYPSWADPITLPNDADQDTILNTVQLQTT